MKSLIVGLLIISSVFSQEYNRKEWRHWIDADKDGQDTRQEVLIDENLASVENTEFNEKGKISKGLWVCKFTGDSITNPRELDVDHLVPLKEAHLSGGMVWSKEERKAYANELLSSDNHLVAVKASANRSKGAKDPSKWMPEKNKCWYLKAWLEIKTRWSLDMDVEEQSFIEVHLEEICDCYCDTK